MEFMRMKTKVSIITVTYNSESTIQNTIDSILQQTYSDIEYIIIDGLSSDKTLSIVEKNRSNFMSRKISLRVFSEADYGIYNAMNKGIQIATGEVVGFLNSDDVYFSKNSLKYIISNFTDSIDSVYGNLVYVNRKNKKLNRIWKSRTFKKGLFRKGWMPPHPTFYCKLEKLKKVNGFNEKLWIAGDFDLMLRLLEIEKIKSKYINKYLIAMDNGGLSNKNLGNRRKAYKEISLILRENNIEFCALRILLHKLLKFFQIVKAKIYTIEILKKYNERG